MCSVRNPRGNAKTAFASLTDAWQAQVDVHQAGYGLQCVYVCPTCGQYHLTTQPESRQDPKLQVWHNRQAYLAAVGTADQAAAV